MKQAKRGVWLALCAVLGCGTALAEDAAVPRITPGRILKTTAVVYPLLDRRFSHEDRVVVSLELNDEGKALTAVIAQPSAWQGLDDAALKTALEWEYSPGTTADGKPVASTKLVAVTFKLKPWTPDERAEIDGDVATKIGFVLGSYYTYRKTADEFLDACGKRGFDTTGSQTLLRESNRELEPRIAQLERYLDEQDVFKLSRVRSTYRDSALYSKLIRMDELREGPVEKAKERCTRIMANFAAGTETLQHFDPLSYRMLGEIQLENSVSQ